ncbi:hypothetical protein EW15_0001 [Prochlorococcus sp. MIT 0801]|nr:hypothetical protein EW15_0001 [Prochlorococcus sp. MIT 0801]
MVNTETIVIIYYFSNFACGEVILKVEKNIFSTNFSLCGKTKNNY